jgi:hypothetical protein
MTATQQKPLNRLQSALSRVKTPFCLTASLQAIASGNESAILKTHNHVEPELRELRCMTRNLADLVETRPDGNLRAEEVECIATATAVYADLVSAHILALLDAVEDKGGFTE